MYINEDYEKYNIGDKLEWAGTKKPGELANIAVAQGTNGKSNAFLKTVQKETEMQFIISHRIK